MSKLTEFYKLQVLRAVILSAITTFIAKTITLGTPLLLLILAIILGVAIPGNSLQKQKTFLSALKVHFIFFTSLSIILWLANLIITSSSTAASFDFLIPQLADDIFILSIFYTFSFLSTWFFWCKHHALTFEALAYSLCFIFLLSAHQNYQTDSPKLISQLAWDLNIEPHHFFLSLGIIFTIFLTSYLALASNRQLLTAKKEIVSFGKKTRLALLTIPSWFFLILISFAYYVNLQYQTNISRAQNGVGRSSEEGKSPLGFHSAVGQSKQPSALVRLENSYSKKSLATNALS